VRWGIGFQLQSTNKIAAIDEPDELNLLSLLPKFQCEHIDHPEAKLTVETGHLLVFAESGRHPQDCAADPAELPQELPEQDVE
jgi:hypothetical protein